MILAVALIMLQTASAQEITPEVDFHVGVAGSGIFHPGDDTILTLLVETEVKSLNGYVLNENTSDLLMLLTTAKDVRIEVNSIYSVLRVKTVGEQILGDLPSGRPVPVNFRIKVNENAREGTYSLGVNIRYTSISAKLTQDGAELTYHTDQSKLINVDIKIEKKDYDFSIKSVTADLIAGREGVVEVIIENSGESSLYDAVLVINTTPPLRPNPKAMSAYLGDLESGEEATGLFRVYVMEGAFLHSYPVELILKFRTPSGVQSAISKTVGLEISSLSHFDVEKVDGFLSSAKTIRIERKIQTMSITMPFPVQQSEGGTPVTSASVITIPSRGYLTLKITNGGDEIRDAYAILSFNNQMLRAENSPFIGDLGKGESKVVTFYITSSSPPGDYLAYLILSYRNEFGDEILSPKHFLSVHVEDGAAINISEVETRNIGVGTSGDVELTLDSTVDAKNVSLYLLSPDSTITPVSSSAYLEDLNEKAEFRISVSDEALAGNHILYLVERFDTPNAQDIVSIAEFTIPVAPKLATFQVLSVTSDLHPDSTGNVVVEIKNAGNAEVYNTIVILDVSSPLSIAGASTIGNLMGQSQSGTYFVGTLKPGDAAIARFRVDVDKDAGEGSYPASIKVKYYDDKNYEHISNSIVISLDVKSTPPYLIVVALIFAAVAVIAAVKFAKQRRGRIAK
jgi:hypothetical protein